MFLTQTSISDYNNLCRLDVPGLADWKTVGTKVAFHGGGITHLYQAMKQEVFAG